MTVRRILIALNVVAPLVLVGLWITGHFWIGLAVVFVAHMLVLIATLVPGCAWWGPLVTRLDTLVEDGVWLTIDDGPDPEDTPAVLRHLEAHGARATFFVIGEKARRWPELVRAIIAGGHGVENHTLTHPKFSFWRLGARRLRAEIEGGQKAICEAGAPGPTRFRAPAGMRNFFVHRVLRDLGLELVGWSVRGRDGVSTDRDAIVARIGEGIEPGAVLLMHESMRDEEGKSVIVDTLPRVLAEIDRRGLRTVLPD
jgi:peptidoglycan/xylan/chitin deacetylase (PgdA/CDA1 family)